MLEADTMGSFEGIVHWQNLAWYTDIQFTTTAFIANDKEAICKSEIMKPKLHKSQLGMFERCPVQYKYRYIDNRIKPPGSAMILGTSVHVSSEKDLTAKRDKGKLLSLEEVQDTAKDAVNEKWDEAGVELDYHEKRRGEWRVKGETVDKAIKLAKLHHKKLAPKLDPNHIERPFTVELKNFPVDMSGTMDLQEKDGTLRDLKTRSKTPPDNTADLSLDLSFYGLAAKALDGEYPKLLAMDFLVKTRSPSLVIQTTTRNEAAYKALLMRIEVICRAIESGVFVPCSADSWSCSPSYCGYYDICDFGRKAKVQG